MQFLPLPLDTYSSAIQSGVEKVQEVVDKVSKSTDDTFGELYKSYIEEGRDVYVGVPEGFPVKEISSDGINSEQRRLLKEQLLKHNISESSVSILDRLGLNGQSPSMTSIFSALSGNSRISDALNDEEANVFKNFFGRLGLKKEDIEDMLADSDDGKFDSLWSKIQEAIQSSDFDDISVEGKDLLAIANSMDCGSDVKQHLMTVFSELSADSFNKDQLQALLSSIEADFNNKKATQSVLDKVMRDAMAEAKKIAEYKAIFAPNSDIRTDRRAFNSKTSVSSVINKNLINALDGQDDLYSSVASEGKITNLKAKASSSGKSKPSDEEIKKTVEKAIHQANKLSRVDVDSKSDVSLSSSSDSILKEQPKLIKGGDLSLVSDDLRYSDSKFLDGQEYSDNSRNFGNNFKQQSGLSEQSTINLKSSDKPIFDKLHEVGQSFNSFLGVNLDSSNSLSSHANSSRAEKFSHIQSNNFFTSPDGSKNLVLQLETPDLGKLTIMLQSREGEIRALIKTESQDSTTLLNDQLATIKQQFEESGLKVAEVDVQTQLQEDYSSNSWNNSERHNAMQDAQEQSRLRTLQKIRKESAVEGLGSRLSLKLSDNGLHIVA